MAEPHRCDNCDGIDPASCVNAPTLRDRIADALYQWTLSVAAPRATRPPYLDPRTEERLRENSLARANAVLPVVEAETGALTHLLRKTEDELHEARQRADEAEAAVQRVRELAEELAGLAPGDEWGDDMASTVGADIARRFLAALDPPEETP